MVQNQALGGIQMYIGQIGSNTWFKNSWLNGTGFSSNHTDLVHSLSKGQNARQSKATNRDRLELSHSYPQLSNRLQILETPEATQVESNLNLAADLRPASENEQYTEEDALMNQYMKQYRLDFIKIGDSFELDPSQPIKLMTEGQVSQESLDAFRTQLEKNGLGDDIDWRGVQEDFLHMDIRFDNAKRFETKVDYLASRYAVLKDRIQTQYTGEKLEQEMQTLDTLYTQAKEELANSYSENIGGFYEGMGQSGIAEGMKESVLSAIDNRANEYTSYLTENDIYADMTDPSKQWLKQDDGYMAAKLRETITVSSMDTPATQTSGQHTLYNANDLSFAASYAKELSEQIDKPTWDTYEINSSDADLGKYLAQQYQSLTDKLQYAGISNQLSDQLKDSFEPFMDQFLNALDAKIGQNWERVAKKPWQSGLIRTQPINREEVYRAFRMFQ